MAPVEPTLHLFYCFIFCSLCSRSEYTVSTVYRDHIREAYNVSLMSSCPLYIEVKNYMSLIERGDGSSFFIVSPSVTLHSTVESTVIDSQSILLMTF